MILYIFNNYFFDDNGFSKRCKREIDMLTKKEHVIVICRKDAQGKKYYKTPCQKVLIIGFDPQTKLLENIKNYQTGLYELYRNSKLLYSLSKALMQCLLQQRKLYKAIHIYVVSSPMTVALLALFFSKIFRIRKTIVEFHDLEPEMALHMKKLQKNNFIMKIEYQLEKILCRQFSKIIVSNTIQKTILVKRSGITAEKVFVIPNTVTKVKAHLQRKNSILPKVVQQKKNFIIGYISTMTFDYTFMGLLHVLSDMRPLFRNYPEIKFLIVGDGEGVQRIAQYVKNYRLEDNIILTGKISFVNQITKHIDVGIIPWEKDVFTKTLLPTKLFEFLAARIPVIVPNFGAFPDVIVNNKNGSLYSSYTDLIKKILTLKNDKKKRDRLARNGYTTFLEKYTLDTYARSYVQFFHI